MNVLPLVEDFVELSSISLADVAKTVDVLSSPLSVEGG